MTKQVPPKSPRKSPPQVLSPLAHALSGEMSRQEWIDSLGLKDRKHFADAYLQPALDNGLLEMTIQDKPNSSKQHYRLTVKGEALAR